MGLLVVVEYDRVEDALSLLTAFLAKWPVYRSRYLLYQLRNR